jgi:hypothetical protein
VTRRFVRAALTAIGVIVAAPAAAQQANTQLWAELTAEWIKSHAWTFKIDVEPKTIVTKPADLPGWSALEVTLSVEYSPWEWVDLVDRTNELYSSHAILRDGSA